MTSYVNGVHVRSCSDENPRDVDGTEFTGSVKGCDAVSLFAFTVDALMTHR